MKWSHADAKGSCCSAHRIEPLFSFTEVRAGAIPNPFATIHLRAGTEVSSNVVLLKTSLYIFIG